MTSNPETTVDAEFHVRRVERETNARLGGDATIRELIRLMLDMGWTPPKEINNAAG